MIRSLVFTAAAVVALSAIPVQAQSPAAATRLNQLFAAEWEPGLSL